MAAERQQEEGSRKEANQKETGQKERLVLAAKVLRRQRLSTSFARITLAGDGLAHFVQQGHDQWFRLFLPKQEQQEGLRLPTCSPDPLWFQQYTATPEAQRPWMRYVTVRDHRHEGADGPEIDVDVVVHGQPGSAGSGPLSTWAQTVQPGEPVALLDQGLLFRPEAAGDGLLLVGDETALPAVAGVLRSLPPSARGLAIVELPYQEDVQTLQRPAGVELLWLQRGHAAPGSKALATARSAIRRGERPYVYGAGEAGMAAGLQQMLREELDWPKERMTVVTYWRHAGHAPA